jgi:type VI secretion system protein ImpH
MTQERVLKSLHCSKTFFELMRRIEAMGANMRTQHEVQNRIPKGVHLMQPAEMQFSSSEISQVSIENVGGESKAQHEIRIEHRNFGLFAPYGPLPIHITEHAWVEKRFDRNEAFEQFINLLSSNMAWLYYRAWSAMHPALCFDRVDRPFVSRLNALVQIEPSFIARHHHSVNACRIANPGVYLNTQRPLAAMQRILKAHFQVKTTVYPRRGRWCQNQHSAHVPVQVGSWRLGHRAWDVQQTIDIEIGPIEAKAFQAWQRRSVRIKAVDAVVRDYTQARVDFAIHVLVRTHPDLAIKVGAAQLGVNTWLKPRHALKRLTVHEAF